MDTVQDILLASRGAERRDARMKVVGIAAVSLGAITRAFAALGIAGPEPVCQRATPHRDLQRLQHVGGRVGFIDGIEDAVGLSAKCTRSGTDIHSNSAARVACCGCCSNQHEEEAGEHRAAAAITVLVGSLCHI